MMRSDARIVGLDGVRALAVAGVILFHWNVVSFGWVGVWVFFVLSAFVITRTLIHREDQEASRSAKLWAFYMRRLRRIGPLYAAAIALGIVVVVLEYRHSPLLHAYLIHVPFLLTSTYNFYRIWPGHRDIQLFGHLWSLSVEEQFYWVFPLLFLFFSRRHVIGALLIIIIAAPIIRYAIAAFASLLGWEASQSGNAVYLFSPGQFDAFALGALIALFEPQLSKLRLLYVWLAVVLFTLLCVAIYAPTHFQIVHAFALNPVGDFKEVWVYAVIDLCSAALILTAIYRPGVLAWRPLTFLGVRSYGIYVIHFPLLWFWARAWLRLNPPLPGAFSFWASFGLYSVVLVLTAHISFTYFERPLWAKATQRELPLRN
jgi:peptidoglycan/LPS O-acetylase OafA/YrhL